MLIRVGYEIALNLPQPVPMILKLFIHPSAADRIKKQEQLMLDPSIAVEEFIDGFGNRCARIVAPPGKLRLWNDAVVEDSGLPDVVNFSAQQQPVSDLPKEVLPYLLSSRYCEVELLSEPAWRLFGHTQPGWSRVQAICDWVYNNIRYGYEHTHASKTAHGVYAERNGVCRDFAHLAIAFCRCMHIPARYVTGYLGDIGIPPQPTPMDFHAWFEVFLDGQWYNFDARHNVPRIGRILMARGRDATDVALTTSFGAVQLELFRVWTDELAPAPEDSLLSVR
jgi:transglutaminase-like putative cysteine protease